MEDSAVPNIRSWLFIPGDNDRKLARHLLASLPAPAPKSES
jgi:hypothetical protein